MVLLPVKALRPCNYFGCAELIRDGRYCDNHKKEKQRQQDDRRGSAAARGYGSTWQKVRLAVLREEPLCRRCYQETVIKAAEVVHHINGNQYDNSRSNLEPLCKRHHDEHTAREQAFGRK